MVANPHPLADLIFVLKEVRKILVAYAENGDPVDEHIKFVDRLLNEVGKALDKRANNVHGHEIGIKLDDLDFLIGFHAKENRKKTDEIKRLNNSNQNLLDNIKSVLAKLKKMSEPPHDFPFFEGLEKRAEDEFWVRLRSGNRHYSALLSSNDLVEDAKKAVIGRMVRTNQDGAVVEFCSLPDHEGKICEVIELVGKDRVRIKIQNDDEAVVSPAGWVDHLSLKPGDLVLIGTGSGLVTEILQKSEVKDLVLEKVPDLSWSAIGGLSEQIAEWRNEVETVIVEPAAASRFKLGKTKGIIISGPPGCGKTMLIRVATSETIKFLREKTGKSIEGYYLLVSGPADVLRGIVGDSPRRIRSVFAQAKRKAKEENTFVVIILDEFESLCPIRNNMVLDAGVSNQDVNQFNAEMDGVEGLDNVLVVALSNRPDMIDPAVVRPGRFDTEIYVSRPDRIGAAEIFSKYIEQDIQFHSEYRDKKSEEVVNLFVESIVARCYDEDRPENRLSEIHYVDGELEIFTFANLMSGALIKNIVDSAKKIALRRYVSIVDQEAKAADGMRLDDFYQAMDKVLKKEIHLPGGEQAWQEWLQVEGRKFRQVRKIVPLLNINRRVSAGERMRGDIA